jgi:hypothetical protein
MLFKRRTSRKELARLEVQSDLMDMLLGMDEFGRQRLVLLALQTGELRESEAKDFLRLVDRLESAGRPTRTPAVAAARK